MAPALSKPSDTAKKFIIRANVKEGRVIGIKISSDEMKAALRKASVSYQAMVNKNLKEAEVNHVANAIIQAALYGEVVAAMVVIPPTRPSTKAMVLMMVLGASSFVRMVSSRAVRRCTIVLATW
jgi:hypothetical protein